MNVIGKLLLEEPDLLGTALIVSYHKTVATVIQRISDIKEDMGEKVKKKSNMWCVFGRAD